MEAQLAVGAVVLRGDGAVLLVRRARPPGVGTWTLPGGKVNPSESLEEALIREIAEETGLRVTPKAVVETIDLEREGYSYRIVDFVCHFSGEASPRAADDVDAVCWVLPEELPVIALTPEVLRVIARARQIE